MPLTRSAGTCSVVHISLQMRNSSLIAPDDPRYASIGILSQPVAFPLRRDSKQSVNKTNFTIFGPQCSAHDYSSCTIRLNGQDIKHVNECKFLGIYLDTHLTWKRHIERISAKISSAIFAINRARNFLSIHALRCLYFALVHSHLTYGIHVWGNSMAIKKIITLQKRAIRKINKVWYRSHTEPLFKSNQIQKFEDMYTMQISLFVYDLNNDLLPKSFRNLLSQNCLARHGIITRQNNLIPQSRQRTTFSSKLPKHNFTRIWNKLVAP